MPILFFVFSSFIERMRHDGQVAFTVRVHPGAKRTQAKGVIADGTLKIDIASAPEDGKANAELIRFLSDAFVVSRSCVEILRGHVAKTKTVRITAAP